MIRQDTAAQPGVGVKTRADSGVVTGDSNNVGLPARGTVIDSFAVESGNYNDILGPCPSQSRDQDTYWNSYKVFGSNNSVFTLDTLAAEEAAEKILSSRVVSKLPYGQIAAYPVEGGQYIGSPSVQLHPSPQYYSSNPPSSASTEPATGGARRHALHSASQPSSYHFRDYPVAGDEQSDFAQPFSHGSRGPKSSQSARARPPSPYFQFGGRSLSQHAEKKEARAKRYSSVLHASSASKPSSNPYRVTGRDKRYHGEPPMQQPPPVRGSYSHPPARASSRWPATGEAVQYDHGSSVPPMPEFRQPPPYGSGVPRKQQPTHKQPPSPNF
ncbi:hypothetical protein NP233_g11315 [Leucocoprinus birnbaumii]|uniref:Uncharacterized protein n=1 Tax=Leucocoprinus birnbaumii TaxID=56174 RepID=A0AAD5VGS3_9AGAR|nr:hypothetical protein NP233_g11315 [Leucocoprinus birnbaumii]